MEHEGDADIDEPYVAPVGTPLGGMVGDQASPAQPAVADTAEGECGRHREPSPSRRPLTQSLTRAPSLSSGTDVLDMEQEIQDGDTRRPMTEEEKREQVKRSEVSLVLAIKRFGWQTLCEGNHCPHPPIHADFTLDPHLCIFY